MTPLPWKLVDDSAIWTQNWSLIPPLPRGNERSVRTACTICPGGCPVKARTIGGVPVSLAGAPGHPAGDGHLCPIGLAGHHLAFHPLRIRQPWIREAASRQWRPADAAGIVAELGRRRDHRGGGISIGVLDRRPGRAASATYREFLLRAGGGLYITPHHSEEAGLEAIRRRCTPDPGPLGYDLERARAILSFGAPLLEGWGSPSRMRKILGDRPGKPLLIHVDHRLTPTARLADIRIALRPGGFADLACGIGREILAGNTTSPAPQDAVPDLEEYRRMVEPFTPDVVAASTGIEPELVSRIARELARLSPAVVIDGADAAAGPSGRRSRDSIAALNIILGSVNRPGGILPRNPVPGGSGNGVPQSQLCDVAEGSLDLLLLDEADSGLAIPEALIRRTVESGRGMVVAFSPYLAGAALAADAVIPVSAPYETLEEVLTPGTDPRTAVGLSAPLLAPGLTGDARRDFLSAVAGGEAGPGDEARRTGSPDRLVAAIAGSGKGSLAGGPGFAAGETRGVPGADELRSALAAGAWWFSGEPAAAPRMETRIFTAGTEIGDAERTPGDGAAFVVIPSGTRGTAGNSAVPPLARKIFQESGLRRPSGNAGVHPATAAAAGIPDGGRARILTAAGGAEVTVHHDALVMPGVIELACGPASGDTVNPGDALSICAISPDGSWCATPAALEEA
jgi:anaerobic selenocysteine-containing dehydrogenase